jgi:hypothetical protein
MDDLNGGGIPADEFDLVLPVEQIGITRHNPSIECWFAIHDHL